MSSMYIKQAPYEVSICLSVGVCIHPKVCIVSMWYVFQHSTP